MPHPSPFVSRKPFGCSRAHAFSRSHPTAAGLLLLMVSAPILAAQNLSTWQAGPGAWLDAAKWTPNGVPNTAAADVVIDGAPGTASTVSYGYDPSLSAGVEMQVGRLRIDTGDQLVFTNRPNTLTMVGGGFVGAGAIQLNGTLALPFTNNSLYGTKTISGAGTLTLGSAGHRPFIRDNTTTGVLIQGSAAFGVANSSNPKIINSGIINANIPGQDMDFHAQGGANRSVNTGEMKATNGAIMSLGQGEWLNAGATMTADGAGSRLGFYRGGLIEGGTISATNGGVVQVGGNFAGGNGGATFKNLTLSGPTAIVNTLLVNDTLTNNGVITIPGGAAIENASNSVTLNGTGQIVLDAPEDNFPELINQGNSSLPSVPWLFSGVKVRGRGNVGYKLSGGAIDNVAITNQGTFEADVDGQTLMIDVANFDNRSGGLLRATGSGNNALGGVLRLGIGGALKNTGGTIEALNNGRVEAGFARIEGGLVRNNGGFIDLNGLTLVNPGTGMRLEGDLTLGKAGTNQQAGLVGTIENAGVLRLKGTTGQALVIMGEAANPSVTLTGGGELVLGDPATGQATSGFYEPVQATVLANTDHTIRGFGFIGNRSYDSGLILQNSGLVMADVSGRTLDAYLREITNQGGTFRAKDGATLNFQVRGGINNTGGIIEAVGGTVAFSGARVTNGILRNNAGTFNLSNAMLVNSGDGLTLQGTHPFTVDSNKVAGLVGNIVNEGTIHLRPSGSTRATLAIGLPGTLSNSITGGGEIVMGDASLPGANDPRIRNGDQAYNNVALTLNDQTLRGFGVIGFNEGDGREMLLTNNGNIRADVSGRALAFVPKTLTNSPGRVIRATGGGDLYFNPVTLTNTGATLRAENGSKAAFDGNMVLIGGTVETQAGGTMEFLRQFTAQGGVEFANSGTALFGSGNGNVTFEGLANGGTTFNNTGTGTIRKTGNGDYTLRTVLTSSGAISVDNGILRNMGGGAITGGSHTVAAGTNLTFQNAPGYVFSGENVFNGAGVNWFADGVPITLANAATKLVVENLNFNTASLTGPGLLSHVGNLGFYENSTNTISGPRIHTAFGATASIEIGDRAITLSNSSSWENEGRVTFRRYGNPRISGDSGTFFDNTSSGILTVDKLNGAYGVMDIPSANKGQINVVAGNLSFEKPSAWTGGTASIGAGLELRVTSTALNFSGTSNSTTGAGLLNLIGNGSLALPAGAKLTAERVQFIDKSRPSGPGELHVTAAANFHPNNTSDPLDSTQVTLLPGSTSLIQYFGGIWGLQNNAKLRNEGTLNFRSGFNMELKTGGVLENAGTMTFTSTGNNPGFNGDGLGLFRTLNGSTARFFPSNGNSWTIGWPFDFAGQIAAESGMNLTFDRGGLFNESAKLLLPHAGSAFYFTGAGKTYRARGRAVEFSGVGYVNFMGTTLQFEPSTVSTPGNGQLDETMINAGARVAFHGNNVVKSVGTHGTLSSTGLVFQNGDQTVENATLETTGGDTSVWNATGRKVTFTSGAKFRNTGRFVIQATAGGPGNPAFTGGTDTLFHNTSTGRLVHDVGSTTEFAMPFQNDGVLEFRAGVINFTGIFAGNGGISASGGAKVTLPLGTGAPDKLPSLLQTSGLGTEINIALPGGDKIIRVDVNGGKLVAAGGGNLVAAGGLNMVAAGGGNLVAAGGMNMVAAGGGNITAKDLNTLLVTNNLIGLDGSTLVGMNGSAMQIGGNLGLSSGAAMALTAAKADVTNLVQLNDSSLVGNDGASLTNAGAMELLNQANASFAGPLTKVDTNGLIGLDSSTLIGNDGSTIESHVGLIGNDGSTLIGNDGSTLIGNDGSTFQGRSYRKAGPPAKSLAALAPGDATIIANTGTTIGGNGIFKGIGSIRTGSFLRPGKPVAQGGNQLGAMTWTGSLEVKSTATLEVQIGGPAASTQHDRINVSGAFALDGNLAVSFINGFGPGLAPASTFDIVVANGGVSSGLDGTRVPVSNAYGTFLVSVVNGGTTLRLSDYQTVPATFNLWAQRFGLTGADALPGADPNGSGLTNLMKYALGLDYSASGNQGTSTGVFEDGQGGRFLTFSYTKPTGSAAASDVTYEPQRAASPATGPWSGSAADVVSAGPAVPGPGDLETITVRSTHPMGSSPGTEYLRLRVVLTPAP